MSNVNDLIAAIKKMLPILKFFATLTPTTVDDKAIAWLEAFLNNIPAVTAAIQHTPLPK